MDETSNSSELSVYRGGVTKVAAMAVLVACLVLAPPSAGATKARTSIGGWSSSAVTLAADDALSRRVTVRTGRRTPSRTVVLQFRGADQRGWTKLTSTISNRRGVARLRVGGVPGSGWVRVKVRATRTARAAVTSRAGVTVTPPGTGDPTGATTGGTPAAYEAEVLLLTNRIRATGTTCGATEYGPRPPLTANPKLGRASRQYARRMGEKDFFAHVSPAGDDPGDRAEGAGYDWSSYGENIAAGYRTPREVVAGWHDSVGHCKNLMGDFAHLGVGYAEVAGSRYGSYWVQMFGTPAR
jgi:uncharacterized protein YkwD